MKVVMAMKVRDERDVIEWNLRHHLALGVDQFVVTDNGSSDGTEEVFRRYRDAGLLHLISEPAEDMHSLGHGWVTRMARLAATELDADWVVHADADELWWPLAGNLKEMLAEVPAEYGAVVGPRPEFAARPDGSGEFWERMTVREARSSLRPKIAHRAEPEVELHRGAHDADLEPDAEGSAARQQGRAVVRALKENLPSERPRLVWSPCFPARVLHFPIRSFEQYRLRVETMLFHGGFPDRGLRRKLRKAYEEGRLPELYEELVVSDDDAQQGIEEGTLVRDEGVRDFLRRVPDPLAGGPATVGAPAAALSEEERAAELRALELDGMATLARTQRSLVRQLDKTRERLDRRTADAAGDDQTS